MTFPSIAERLKTVSEVLQYRADLHEYLELQKKILLAQSEMDIYSKKTRADWIGKLSLSSLEKKVLDTKEPLVHFLDFTVFDANTLVSIFRKVVEALISKYPKTNGLRKLVNHLNSIEIDFVKLVEASLREDKAPIIKYSEEFKIEASSLLFAVNASVQPFIEEISRRVTPTFYDKWWREQCPICGKTPSVARIRNRRRYLMCDFCGAEYPSDYFLCVHCGNKDPYTLKYLIIDEKPEFQIDFCTKCNHYVKVIITNALKEPIPRFLEDILTLNLDIEAKNAGLLRDS